MGATYNITQLTEITVMSDLFRFANDSTGGILIVGMLLAIFFVMILSMRDYEFESRLMSSGFVCFILSGLFSAIGLINVMYVLGFLSITIIGAVISHNKSGV